MKRPLLVGRKLVVAASLCALPASAQHQETMADALFREARQDMKAGQHAKACPKLEESLRLDPSPGTLLNLAICKESIGMLATAAARFRQLTESLPPADERAGLASARLAALQPRIPQLRLVLAPSVPRDARVELDGIELRGAALVAWLPVDPGVHVVLIRVGSTEQVDRVTLVEAQRLEKTIEWAKAPASVVATSAPSAGAPATSHAPERSNTLAIATLGVGAAGLVTSVVAGAMVLQRKGVVADHCHERRCDQQGLDAASSGSTLQTVANVAFAVGVVGIGVGSWLMVSPGSHRGASIGYKAAF